MDEFDDFLMIMTLELLVKLSSLILAVFFKQFDEFLMVIVLVKLSNLVLVNFFKNHQH